MAPRPIERLTRSVVGRDARTDLLTSDIRAEPRGIRYRRTGVVLVHDRASAFSCLPAYRDRWAAGVGAAHHQPIA